MSIKITKDEELLREEIHDCKDCLRLKLKGKFCKQHENLFNRFVRSSLLVPTHKITKEENIIMTIISVAFPIGIIAFIGLIIYSTIK